jgi:hypothetical protein
MKFIIKQSIIMLILLTININCFSNEIKRVEFTSVKSINIYISPFTGSYSTSGGIKDKIRSVKKNAGIRIIIGSILQIVNFEQKLKFEKFKSIKNYNEYIKDYEIYVVIDIDTNTGLIELIYDGEYLIDLTRNMYRKPDKKLFNFF